MELWDAYTRDEVRTGEKLVRGVPIPDGVYHLVSEILVCHVDGDFLLMQRDPTKIAYPGYWEATAGGSALVGEGPIDCAKRELYEETGIAEGNLTQISQEIAESIHTIYHGYLCVTTAAKDAIRLQTGETVAYWWHRPAGCSARRIAPPGGFLHICQDIRHRGHDRSPEESPSALFERAIPV